MRTLLSFIFLTSSFHFANADFDPLHYRLARHWPEFVKESLKDGDKDVSPDTAFRLLIERFVKRDQFPELEAEAFGSLIEIQKDSVYGDTYSRMLFDLSQVWNKLSTLEKQAYVDATVDFFQELKNLNEDSNIDEITTRAYRYLFTKEGCRIFQKIGDYEFEQGNLLEALKLYEVCLRYSRDGLENLSPNDRNRLFSWTAKAHQYFRMETRMTEVPFVKLWSMYTPPPDLGVMMTENVDPIHRMSAETPLPTIKQVLDRKLFSMAPDDELTFLEPKLQIGNKLYIPMRTQKSLQVGWIAWDLKKSRIIGGHAIKIAYEDWDYSRNSPGRLSEFKVSFTTDGNLQFYFAGLRHDIDVVSDQMTINWKLREFPPSNSIQISQIPLPQKPPAQEYRYVLVW